VPDPPNPVRAECHPSLRFPGRTRIGAAAEPHGSIFANPPWRRILTDRRELSARRAHACPHVTIPGSACTHLRSNACRLSVEYTDTQAPRNQYPYRIISPAHSIPCCVATMEEIGPEAQGAHWVYRSKRCRACGFTVRLVVRALPAAALLPSRRKALSIARSSGTAPVRDAGRGPAARRSAAAAAFLEPPDPRTLHSPWEPSEHRAMRRASMRSLAISRPWP
jgi:hypothetical protein